MSRAPILLLAAVVIAALALGGHKAKKNKAAAKQPQPAVCVGPNCPECVGPNCPAPFQQQLYNGVRIDERSVNSTLPPVPREPVRVLEAPEAPRITQAVNTVLVSNRSSVSKDGWRLRYFYPEDNVESAHAKKGFLADPDLADFAEAHGYDSMSTKDSGFDVWREAGFPEDRPTIVLVAPNNDIIYRTHAIPAHATLHAALKRAVDRSVAKAKYKLATVKHAAEECICVPGVKKPGPMEQIYFGK